MNVATKMEIATSGTTTLTHGKLGTASAAGLAGTAQSSISTKASTEKSFRAGWQALLASLSSDVKESSKTAANQVTASTKTVAGEAAGNSSGTTSSSSANSGLSLVDLRLNQVAEKGNEKSSAAAKLSAADARTEGSTAWTDAKTTKSVSTKTEEKKTSTEQKTKSNNNSTSSADSVKTTDSTVTSAVDVVPAASASVPQVVPTPVTVNSVAPSTNEKSPAMSSGLSTDVPTCFAATSFSSHLANVEGTFNVSEKSNAAGRTTGKETEKTQDESQAKSGSIGSSSSDGALTTALANAPEAVSPSSGLRTENRSQPDVSTSSLKQRQAVEPDQNSPQTLVTSQDATPAQASSQSQVQKSVQSDKALPVQSANRVVSVDAASTTSTDEALQPVAISAAVQSGQSTETFPIMDKSSSASSAKLSISNTAHITRRSGNADSVQMASSQGQSSSTVADASAVARDVADAQKVVGTSSEFAGASTASPSGSSSSETFAALDAGSSTGTPAWIHAGAHQAEAGFHDPTLGWVGIRANTSGGGVHAQLMTDSTDAVQALSSQLTGLSTYLAEHRTPVETLTLTASDGGSAGWGSDQSAGQGMQQNTGQQAGQETAQGANVDSQIRPYQGSSVMTEASSQIQTGFDGNTQVALPGGSRISVMA